MNIAIVGTGYVGLVSGACFSEMGVDVTCVDIDADKIACLKSGEIPIYEPGLKELVLRNVEAGRLHFTTSLAECLDDVEVVFSAVGTPPDEDGGADLSHVLDVARTFGRNINRYTLLVTKSTVPVGTASKVKDVISGELSSRGVDIDFEVASNPEFLKEGAAIKDFMSPDRVVVGVESERAKAVMTKLYRPFLTNNFRVYFMDIPSAEMTKYAANAMLATRISFMNDIANLCDHVGADINMVRKGIGTDVRIGGKFLYAGCGYGGSCFPKDVKALARTARENGCVMRVVEAVEATNEAQKRVVYDKLCAALGDSLKERRIAVWGLAFKPETDDMRQAPSLVVIESLVAAGAVVRVYDPVAMDECRRRLGDGSALRGDGRVEYACDMYDAALGADALLLLTEWKQFRMPSWSVLRHVMGNPLIIDGRNIYDRAEVESEGFVYSGIGR
ncbi:UDP-glucose/GDP-mannose dehydrogenase family protein [uncultured Muribaculum sp.]|uniref:UDP-glucose dehydrogenase family protein n=1 Tax=uncultured Muribaculum sp. TaxID=1918613 RepID=UPI0025E36A03|nr:UDP-glucose/GDP-mannose dehydrogenase family protein [uncultured Muribaculum sp.]